ATVWPLAKSAKFAIDCLMANLADLASGQSARVTSRYSRWHRKPSACVGGSCFGVWDSCLDLPALQRFERVLEQDLRCYAAYATGHGAGPGGLLAYAFPV